MALSGDIAAIAGAYHGDPFRVLGPHQVEVNGRRRLEVRAFLPEASEAAVVTAYGVHRMDRLHPAGFFEAVLDREQIAPYRLRLSDYSGSSWEIEDPYRFPGWLSDFEIYLHGEGNYLQSYEKLGSHRREIEGVR